MSLPSRGWRQALAVACVGLLLGSQTQCAEPKKVDGFPDEFVGVGLELKLKRGRPRVMRVLKSGAAAAAGLKKGDVLMAIDGKDTEGVSLGAIVVSLRGKPKTQVAIDIDRYGKRIIVVVRRKKMTKGAAGYRAGK